MSEFLALVGFAFVGSVSPGPNNTLLWASGVRFGFRGTVAHVLGTGVGIGTLALIMAAGVGALLEALPASGLVLKLVGSVYLLYVAFLVLRSGGIGRAAVSHPMGLRQAIVFQWVNPKAWIFSIAAVATFLPPDLSRFVGVAVVTTTLMVVVVGSSAIWAAGGAAMGLVVENDRTRQAVSVILAVLLVASVGLIWI